MAVLGSARLPAPPARRLPPQASRRKCASWKRPPAGSSSRSRSARLRSFDALATNTWIHLNARVQSLARAGSTCSSSRWRLRVSGTRSGEARNDPGRRTPETERQCSTPPQADREAASCLIGPSSHPVPDLPRRDQDSPWSSEETAVGGRRCVRQPHGMPTDWPLVEGVQRVESVITPSPEAAR